MTLSAELHHTRTIPHCIVSVVQLLDLEDNNISDWEEVMHLSQLPCLQHLWLGGNQLQCINLLPGTSSVALCQQVCLYCSTVALVASMHVKATSVQDLHFSMEHSTDELLL